MGELLDALIANDTDRLRQLTENSDLLREEVNTDFPTLRYAVKNDNRNVFIITRAIARNKDLVIPEELSNQLQLMYSAHLFQTRMTVSAGDHFNNESNRPYVGIPEDDGRPARASLLFSIGGRFRPHGFTEPFADAFNDKPSIRERLFRAFICG